MGDAIIQDNQNRLSTFRNLTIEPFGKLLFDVIVTLDLHNENKNDCYGAIYTLGCASMEPNANFCHEKIYSMLERQKNRLTYVETGDIIVEAEALKSFVFKHSREQKLSFIDLFDKFVSSICFLYHNWFLLIG